MDSPEPRRARSTPVHPGSGPHFWMTLGGFLCFLVPFCLALRAEGSHRFLLGLLALPGAGMAFLLWRALNSSLRERQEQGEGEILYRTLFESAAVGLARLTPQGHFLDINQEFCTLLGYTRDELVGTGFTFDQLSQREDLESDIQNADRLIKGEAASLSLLKRLRRKDGHLIWAHVFLYLLRDHGGKPHTLVCAAIDITDRKRTEEELEQYRSHLEEVVEARTLELEARNLELKREIAVREQAVSELRASEGRFRFIAENSFDVIWMLDIPTRRLTYVSPSVQRLRGYSPEEVMAQPFDVALTPSSAERMHRMLAEQLAKWRTGDRSDTMRVVEIEQPHKDGRTLHTEIVTTLHQDEAGNPVSILGVTRDITERRKAEEAIRHEAFYDGLTQLPNRRNLLERLQQALARARRDHSRIALLFLDLDKFKPINDELGHHVGDWLLQIAAQRMAECLREYDTAARFGGDEFVILVPDLLDQEDAFVVAERIRAALEQPFVTEEGLALGVSSSIGVAFFPDHADNERDLLRVGDEAMYQAKKTGRNRVVTLSTQAVPRALLSPGAFVQLAWDPEYACGLAAIDAEHRELFRLGNEFLSLAVQPHPDPAASRRVMEQLLGAARAHFRHEEAILGERRYGRLEEHALQHQRLLDHADRLQKEVEAGRVTIGKFVDFVVVELVSKHLLREDRDYYPLFQTPEDVD